MPDLIISVINYQTQDLTYKCLKSIYEKKWKTSYEVWVLDNGSKDGSVEFIQEKFPKIKMAVSDKNLGFGNGHNLNLKNVSSKYILLLNSDTEILEKTLDEMIEFMNQDSSICISSCKVLGTDGNLQPNGGDLPFGFALIFWLFNFEIFGLKAPAFHREDESYYNDFHEVGWVSGNFMLIKTEIWKQLSGFNPKYFMYFEDVDLCFRAGKIGCKIAINPKVSIKHLSGGSADDPKYRQWLGEYRGLIKFYQIYFGFLAGLLIRTIIYLAAALRIIAFSLIGKFGYSKTYAKVIVNI